MTVRGVRGATSAAENTPKAILTATVELLEAILAANPSMETADLASAYFTSTPDLDAAFPAEAARRIGWRDVPLLCGQEIPVPGDLPQCIRVLLHWNSPLPQTEVQHVYLGEARRLRPDLAGPALRQAGFQE